MNAERPGRCGAGTIGYAFSNVLPMRASLDPVEIRCRLFYGHDGPHESVLPAEAAEDAGKLYLWPMDLALGSKP